MTEDQVRQSVVNYLDGKPVLDVNADLDDYMSNVIDAAGLDDDTEREWIEEIARDELKRHELTLEVVEGEVGFAANAAVEDYFDGTYYDEKFSADEAWDSEMNGATGDALRAAFDGLAREKAEAVFQKAFHRAFSDLQETADREKEERRAPLIEQREALQAEFNALYEEIEGLEKRDDDEARDLIFAFTAKLGELQEKIDGINRKLDEEDY